MHSNLNSKELIIQCLKDEFKNKNVQVETVFYTTNIRNYLHSFQNNIFYYGRLTIGQDIPKIQMHLNSLEFLIPDANSQLDILFRRLSSDNSESACQFYGYKFILTDK